jgi:hypothetical protein
VKVDLKASGICKLVKNAFEKMGSLNWTHGFRGNYTQKCIYNTVIIFLVCFLIDWFCKLSRSEAVINSYQCFC